MDSYTLSSSIYFLKILVISVCTYYTFKKITNIFIEKKQKIILIISLLVIVSFFITVIIIELPILFLFIIIPNMIPSKKAKIVILTKEFV